MLSSTNTNINSSDGQLGDTAGRAAAGRRGAPSAAADACAGAADVAGVAGVCVWGPIPLTWIYRPGASCRRWMAGVLTLTSLKLFLGHQIPKPKPLARIAPRALHPNAREPPCLGKSVKSIDVRNPALEGIQTT